MNMCESKVVILTPYRRPDFVAILGVLTRTEIEDYARRTKIVRDARKARFPKTSETGILESTKHLHQSSWTSQIAGARNRDGDRERDGRELRTIAREYVSTSGKARAERGAQSRWKENHTAVGIGGAAASLLQVLSEAAEGL